jgi:SAM-dependent methyltransferase
MSNSVPQRDLGNYLNAYKALPFEEVQESLRRSWVANWLESSSPSSIAEVGCGRESIFQTYFPAERSVIIEPIQEFLDLAMAKIVVSKAIQTHCTTLEEYSVRSEAEQFDVTLLSSILHEVDNPALFLKSAAQITRPGGSIIIVVTNKLSIHRILGVHMGLLRDLNEKTQTELQMQQSTGAFSAEELKDLAGSLGLSVKRHLSFAPKLFSHAQMQELIDRGVIDSSFPASMDRLSGHLPLFGSELLMELSVPG